MSGYSQFSLLTQRRFLPYFTVQALGAFNDNVYRQAIIGLLIFLGASTEDRALYAIVAPAIFILPYFLFSAIAGQIAEKLEKQRLIVITTTMEIVIMSLAAVGFLLQNLPVLLVALFCTGVQSTLFGPVKYSVLLAVLGNVLSRMIPRMDAGAPDLKVHWNPIPESLAVRREYRFDNSEAVKEANITGAWLVRCSARK